MLKLDLYQLPMAQASFMTGRHETITTYEMFYRTVPFKGVHSIVMSGQKQTLELIEQIKSEGWLTSGEGRYLIEQGFNKEFVNFLMLYPSFDCEIMMVEEGMSVYPQEPMVQITGPSWQCQLLEDIVLQPINFQSLIATKARQLKSLVGDRHLAEFGYRRSHNPFYSSRAAMVGGCDSTSNVEVGMKYGYPITGTMAHAFISAYGIDGEVQAFRDFAKCNPNRCSFLLDTYGTERGLKRAILVAKEMEQADVPNLSGVRLDSGDLLSLSKLVRAELDKNGLKYVKIIASNDLDEVSIPYLINSGAPIDIFGVGTRLVTAFEHPALGGVYKLVQYGDTPIMKFSDEKVKMTLPGRHLFTRGKYDLISCWGEPILKGHMPMLYDSDTMYGDTTPMSCGVDTEREVVYSDKLTKLIEEFKV